MKKAPTSENTTHDPDEAPAEREIIGSHMLEAVREHESTGRLLVSLAATATEHAHRNSGDTLAAGVAAILTATEVAYREADDPKAIAFLQKVGKLDPPRSSGLAGSAEDYMREPFRGPRTRAEQADMLCSRVAIDLNNGVTPRQVAENFVAHVRIAPDIAQHTSVPVTGAWRGTQAEAEAVSAVENALDGKDAEAVTRAALRALEYPASKAKNVFTHRDRSEDGDT